MAAAFVPLAVTALPYVAQAVEALLGLVRELRQHPSTPDATKAGLDEVEKHLDVTAQAVRAVPLV